MVMFPSIHMKASRPNACKCNVNLFRFVIVLFSKVAGQWGICNIYFHIILDLAIHFICVSLIVVL